MTSTTTENAARTNRRASKPGFLSIVLVSLCGAVIGCAAEPHAEEPVSAVESWSVTVWGTHYEIFPEVAPLVAGELAEAHTHVTDLDGFTPLVAGSVEIALIGETGEQTFKADEPVRPGIFNVEIRPDAAGEFDVVFRVDGPAGAEEIRGGKVLVGTLEQPGRLLVAPAPKGASNAEEPLDFLKEEQWRSTFATGWVRNGLLARSVSGLAKFRPPAGGEASVTAPVDGVLHPPAGASSWPFTGRRVDRGTALFRLVPRIAAERSLPALEAEVATFASELETARTRLVRLQELLDLEATSLREVEDARTRVETLTARHGAAQRDLEAARSSRQGGTAGGLTLRAPLHGEIAEVTVSPGATVAAGAPLARMVRTDLLWLEVALSPAAAQQVTDGITGVVLSDGENPPQRLDSDLRLISVAPELSPRTGTVGVLLETPPSPGLTLGTTVEAQILLSGQREGIVIPASALIDDGGVPVVYLQLSGESFVRQVVRVLERQGDRLLVEGLTPGQRLVLEGGEAIRRSSLMSSGDAHGHAH